MGVTDVVVSVDPDAQRSGVAVWEGGVLVKLEMWSFVEMMEALQEASQQNQAGGRVVFVLEDVEAIKPTFRRGKTNQAAMQKIAQNVGQVKQTARFIKELADHLGVPMVMVKPLGGVAKSAKTNPAIFKQMTGWAGRSNADTRDAAMLGLYHIRNRQRRAG